MSSSKPNNQLQRRGQYYNYEQSYFDQVCQIHVHTRMRIRDSNFVSFVFFISRKLEIKSHTLRLIPYLKTQKYSKTYLDFTAETQKDECCLASNPSPVFWVRNLSTFATRSLPLCTIIIIIIIVIVFIITNIFIIDTFYYYYMTSYHQYDRRNVEKRI